MGSKVMLLLTFLVLGVSLIEAATVSVNNVSNATDYSGSQKLSAQYSANDNLSSRYSGSNVSYQTLSAQPVPIPPTGQMQPPFSLVSAIAAFVTLLVNKTFELITEAFVKLSFCVFNKLRTFYPNWSGMCY